MSEIFFLEPEYDYNFDVYAVNCAFKEYHLAWLLNKNLSLNLVKKEDIRLNGGVDAYFFFSYFEFFSGIKSFRLIRNLSYDESPACFISDLGAYEFLFLVKDPTESIDDKRLLNRLRKIQGIRKVECYKPVYLKNKEYLIF